MVKALLGPMVRHEGPARGIMGRGRACRSIGCFNSFNPKYCKSNPPNPASLAHLPLRIFPLHLNPPGALNSVETSTQSKDTRLCSCLAALWLTRGCLSGERIPPTTSSNNSPHPSSSSTSAPHLNQYSQRAASCIHTLDRSSHPSPRLWMRGSNGQIQQRVNDQQQTCL